MKKVMSDEKSYFAHIFEILFWKNTIILFVFETCLVKFD